MPRPKTHFFVCVNERSDDHPKGCCRARGGEELAKRLKMMVKERGLQEIKVTRARCLGPCEQGPNMVVYPQGTWYAHVNLDDLTEILDTHLKDKEVERLLNPDMR